MNPIAINSISKDLEAAATFCRQKKIGIEITDFAFPKNLDSDLSLQIERVKRLTFGIAPICSHGPFLDLIANSMDPEIVEVSRKRHRTALEATHAIGASKYIAHTNFNPMIRNKSYREGFCLKMREFWLPFADWAGERKITVCLENLWEPEATIQKEIVFTCKHPNIKASFDNGHALVFSKQPASDWVRILGSDLAHCHLHDNHGEYDEHAAIGTGTENWNSLIKAAYEYSPESVLVIECDQFDKNRKSFEEFKRFQKGAAAIGRGAGAPRP
ncbi:MAG: sugar phosphate isomerase/epimerase [Thermoguttaceae bacterium]